MERRKSFRYPASPERQPAHLQLSGNDCAAILLDESVGGFRVSIGRDDVESAQEEAALLQTYSGWHDVQIVRRIATPDSIELGLVRINDHVEPPEDTVVQKPGKKYFKAGSSGIGGEYVIGLLIIFLVPMAPMLFQKFWNQTPDFDPQAQHESIESYANPDASRVASASRKSKKKTHRTVAESKPKKSAAREVDSFASSVSSGIESLGHITDRAVKTGTRETSRLFQQTARVVHDLLATLSPFQYEQLEQVVDAYQTTPTSENLGKVTELLHEPAYASLEKLVDDGNVSSVELAEILYDEFHL